MSDFVIILFYKFVTIADPEALKISQKELGTRLGLKGRVLIAHEGINATLEGTRENIDAYKKEFLSDPRFAEVLIKESSGTGEAFPKLAVKVRKEIVTFGAGEFDVVRETAKELPAAELEEWYKKDEDFVVLDLRNDYEIVSGAFEKTVNPGLENFRDLPEKIAELEHLKDKKVVAVCTGGIRCEKATCLLNRAGFTDLYQLKDGIHTYMQEFPKSHFKGSLFVFDNRMTTPVVDIEPEVIGKCAFCGTTTEEYWNDDSVRPSKKLLCCESCFLPRKELLRK